MQTASQGRKHLPPAMRFSMRLALLEGFAGTTINRKINQRAALKASA